MTVVTDVLDSACVYDQGQLDAIPSEVLQRIVREAIERHIDTQRLEILRMIEEDEREGLAVLTGGNSP